MQPCQQNTVRNSLFIENVSPSETSYGIQKLNQQNPAGYEGIMPKCLRLCELYVTKPLAHVFNLSTAQGVYSVLLKIANVIPLYIPISILSCI